MILAKLSNNCFSSFPSFFHRFLVGDLMNRNSSFYSYTKASLFAVHVKETRNEYMVVPAIPGMKKGDFNIYFANGRFNQFFGAK